MMNLAIILTGTIRPQVCGGHFSIEERMQMYLGTLDYYAKVIGKKYPIIFVENSDVSIENWKRDFSESLDLEILQFNPKIAEDSEGFDNSKGKGYNEYLMIKKALQKSSKLKECTHFMKITGRYPMKNILTMLHEVEKRGATRCFMADVKDTNVYSILGINNDGRWGDSRFWASEIEFYKRNMADCYLWMDDSAGKYSEEYLYRFSQKYKHDRRFSFRFKHQVRFAGFSGAVPDAKKSGGNYNYDSKKNQVKAVARQFLRIVCPNFWF